MLVRRLVGLAWTLVALPSCREPAVSPPGEKPGASIVVLAQSAPGAATSALSSASAAPEPPKVPPYEPLPKVTACAACPWPGTGCILDGDKECALDPGAWWEVRPERVKPAGQLRAGESACVIAWGDRSACGMATAKKEKGWLVLAPEKPDSPTTVLSTAELVGLRPPHLGLPGRETPAVAAPSFRVDEALFKTGVALRHADGDEIWIRVSPGKASSDVEAPFPTLMPRPGEMASREPEAFGRAEELARKAEAIDSRIASYRRETGLAHRKGGFEVRLVAFFDGKKLVKLITELAILPPLIDVSHYFQGDRLFASRTVVYDVEGPNNDPKRDVVTTFYDDKSAVWSDAPGFDPKKPDPTPPGLAGEAQRALKDPSHLVPDGTL